VLPELANRHVEGLRITPPSLEELFLRHYGDDLEALENSDMGPAVRGTRRARKTREASR
jgi:ABC-2 type transport system ATP-binding protein